MRFLRGLLERFLFLEFDRRRDLLLVLLQTFRPFHFNLNVQKAFPYKLLYISDISNHLCLERDLDLLLLDLDLVRD